MSRPDPLPPTSRPSCRPTARGSLGRRGEQLAARHLSEEDGLEVVARNWRIATPELRGELDLVALDHHRGEVVVCEVKTRRDGRFGGPTAAVNPTKQQRIRRLAVALLVGGGLPYRRVRFDVIGVVLGADGPELEHVERAFE